MTEQTGTHWKMAVLSCVKLLLKPALLLGAGALLIVGLGVAQRVGWISAGGDRAAVPSGEAAKEDNVQYICPMMDTPPQSEPGRCPVCGMELVPATTNRGGGGATSITIDPATRRVANIQTAPVVSKVVSRQIRAVGQISYDEGKLKTLAAYVDGRIDRLYADYTGVVVNQGDQLALLYSPELYTAQSELLAAKRTADRTRSSLYAAEFDSKDLVERARQKLIDLGVTEQQIANLEKTGQPATRIKIVAPIHGTVIARLASEGDYVKTGQAIFRLADLSTVWLMLELFPDDAAAIRYGQHVAAKVDSLTGETFSGRVAFVDPMVNPQTRTVGIRVVIENPDGRLKVGDYATATVDVPLATPGQTRELIYDPELAGKWISPRHPHVIADKPGNCTVCGIPLVPASQLGFAPEPVAKREELVVPRDAVLMAGDQSVVYVEMQPGRFELRRVTLGPSVEDDIVLLSGVKPGERVATNGNFLIDSQMQLAGNPSLIDPTKSEATKPPADSQKDDKIEAALDKLIEQDQALARRQRICPVTKARLGSMGVPVRVEVAGRTVFLCCEGCRHALLDDPEKYLAVLDAQQHPGPPGDLPPIGPIELLDEPPDAGPVGPAPPVGSIQQEASP